VAKTTRLMFAEHAGQVEDLLQRGIDSAAQWIAVGPSAMYALEQHGIRYCVPEDYCPGVSIEAACVDAFERLRRVTERLDGMVVQDGFRRQWGIEPFRLHLWQLGQCLDRIVARDLYLRAIRQAHGNVSVVVHRAPPHTCCTSELCPGALTGAWPRMLEAVDYGWPTEIVESGAAVLSPPRRKINRSSAGLRQSFSALLRRYPAVWRSVSLLRAGLTRQALRSLGGYSGKDIVILGGAYDWPAALGARVFDRFRVRFEDRSDYSAEALPALKPEERGGERVWRELLATFEDNSRLELMREAVLQIACRGPAACRSVVAAVRERVRRREVAAVLNAVSTDFATRAILCAYRSIGVPVVKWQHGSVWYRNRITQRMDLTDLSEPDVLLVFGEAVKAAYERNNPSRRCKVVCAGSANLDRLTHAAQRRPRVAPGGPRLLYVVTSYYSEQWYCGFSPPFSDNGYFRDQVAIVAGLTKLQDVRPGLKITVKLPPSYSGHYEPPWAQELRGRRNFTLIGAQRSLGELLLNHDAVIIDSPTTLLLEALSTAIPAFVLLRTVRWPEECLPGLARRAVCEDDPNVLLQRLEDYLRAGEYGADCRERSFLREYGTHLDDGRSSERAAAVLLEATNPAVGINRRGTNA